MLRETALETELVQKAKEYLVPLRQDRPILVRGQGAIVEDINGQRFIDCASGPGVLNVGHCHPRVVAAAQEQISVLTQCPGECYNVGAIRLAEKLATIAPPGLKRTFFCNSGAAAIDGAIKLAFKYLSGKGRGGGIIALQHSFHGRLSVGVSLTGQTKYKKGFGAYASFPGVIHIPAPYCYRCPLTYPSCDIYCAQALEEALKCSAQGDMSIFICEPILGVGGIVVPPDEYLPRVVEICRQNDMLIIFDEIFTGFGRTGKMFASEHWGCAPDMMTVAKAIGGGLPLAAIISSDEIANALQPNDHNVTFGANNAATCAVGLTSVQVIQEENLPARAQELGQYMLDGLRALMERSRFIGDVRGKGLFIGIELVTDKQKKTPAPEVTSKVKKGLLDRGVIVSSTGVESCTLRVTPPLVIDKEQLDQVLQALESVLAEVEKG